MKKITLIALLLILFTNSLCLAQAPQPKQVQGPGDWTLDVKFEHLRPIELRVGENRKAMRFWYVILTVTNNTGQDVDFYPMCELVTDNFQILPANTKLPTEVFKHIEKRHKRVYPFLEPLQLGSTRILQGQDNTRDIAVIWPEFDAKAKGLQLFVGGLSNETVAVKNPTDNAEPATNYLRKTLELNYSIQGDALFRSRPNLKFEGQNWVMR